VRHGVAPHRSRSFAPVDVAEPKGELGKSPLIGKKLFPHIVFFWELGGLKNH
jgi:hypothetical protein